MVRSTPVLSEVTALLGEGINTAPQSMHEKRENIRRRRRKGCSGRRRRPMSRERRGKGCSGMCIEHAL